MIPVTSIDLQNAGRAQLDGGFTTFGLPLNPGVLSQERGIIAEIGGRLIPVQVDVKNTHADGSARMVMLTFERPSLPVWEEIPVRLFVSDAPQPAARPVSLISTLANHNATISLDILGQASTKAGAEAAAAAATTPIRSVTINVAEAFAQAAAAGKISYWQEGPFATQGRVEIPVANTPMRVVIDATAYADGNVRFMVNLNNDRAMENVTGGWMTYKAEMTLNGTSMFSQTISQAQYQRANIEIASSEKHGVQGLGSPKEGWLNIKHDINYLKSTNAIFQFNDDIIPNPGVLRFYQHNIENNTNWGQLFFHHNVTQDMGMAGTRPDIGPATANVVNWLLSGQPFAAEYVLSQARASSYIPWHYYDMNNNTVLNSENYPRLWTDNRSATAQPGNPLSGGLIQQVPGGTGWGIVRSHQPELSFVPYLLTGERWIYDNLMSQASYSIMSFNPPSFDPLRIIFGGQVRSDAWSMRQVEHAAWAAVDGSKEQSYMNRLADANWQYRLDQLASWQARYGEVAGFIDAPGVYGDSAPVWQSYMFANVAGMAALRGREKAGEVLKAMGNFIYGILHAEQHGLSPYNATTMVINTRWNGDVVNTWAEFAQALRDRGVYADQTTGFAFTEGEYARMYAGALTYLHMVTGEEKYLQALEKFLRLTPPGNRLDAYIAAPQFSIINKELYKSIVDSRGYSYGEIENLKQPVRLEVGSGPDTMILKIAQDYWQGDAHYKVFINGRDVGPTFVAKALWSMGDADTLTIRDNFGDGPINLEVRLLWDNWGGQDYKDLNLYVLAVNVNGRDTGAKTVIGRGAWTTTINLAELPPAPPSEPPPPPPPPPPAEPPVFQLRAVNDSAEEGGTYTFIIQRVRGSMEEVTLTYVIGPADTPSSSAMGGPEPQVVIAPPQPPTTGIVSASSDDIVGGFGTRTIVIPRGQSEVRFTIQSVDDRIVEADEAFTVRLTGASLGTVISTPVTAVIRNNDTQPPVFALRAVKADVTEGEPMTFVIERTSGSLDAAEITYVIEGGRSGVSATPDDVVGGFGTRTVSFRQGQTTAEIVIDTVNDRTVEPDETISVRLLQSSVGTVVNTPIDGVIRNDDLPPPVFALRATPVEAPEGQPLTFVVERTSGSLDAATVTYTVGGFSSANIGNPASSDDIVGGFGTRTIQFAQGQTRAEIRIETVDDRTFEPDEAIGVRLTGASVGTVTDATVVGIIRNNDLPPPVFALRALNADRPEGEALTFVIERTSGALDAATVTYAVAAAPNGNSAAANDIVGGLGTRTVTFAEGQTRAEIRIETVDDRTFEPDESFLVRLTGSTFGTVVETPVTAVIRNNDLPPPVFALRSAQDAVAEGGGARFFIERVSGADDAVTLSFAVEGVSNGNTRSASAEDIVGGFGTRTVTLAQGQNRAEIVVGTVDDRLVEGLEAFSVRLVQASVGTIQQGSAAVVSIEDNDRPVANNPLDFAIKLAIPNTLNTGTLRLFADNQLAVTAPIVRNGPNNPSEIGYDIAYGSKVNLGLEYVFQNGRTAAVNTVVNMIMGFDADGALIPHIRSNQSVVSATRYEFSVHHNTGQTMTGSVINDIFLVDGGRVMIATGNGRDAVFVRDKSHVTVSDFARGVDRLYIEQDKMGTNFTMTARGTDAVISFGDDASITLQGVATGRNWQSAVMKDIVFV